MFKLLLYMNLFLYCMTAEDIDFTDLINYDPLTKQYRNKPNYSVSISSNEILSTEKSHHTSKNLRCYKEDKCVVYMRRYILVLTNLIQRDCIDKGGKDCTLMMTFKLDDVDHYRKLLADENVRHPFNDMDYLIPDVFESLISSLPDHVSPLIPSYINLKSKLFDVLGVSLETLIFILLTFIFAFQTATIIRQSLWRFLFRLTFALFLLSFPWTWFNLYQEAVVKKQLEISAPIECRNWRFEDSLDTAPNSVFSAFTDFVKSWFWVPTYNSKPYVDMTVREKCLQYQRALKVNPFWEITPSHVMVVTITKFILEPLNHLGLAVNTLILQTFSGFPVQYVMGLFTIFALIFITFMLIFCRYRLKLPFFLGALEPAPRQRIENYADASALKRFESSQKSLKYYFCDNNNNDNNNGSNDDVYEIDETKSATRSIRHSPYCLHRSLPALYSTPVNKGGLRNRLGRNCETETRKRKKHAGFGTKQQPSKILDFLVEDEIEDNPEIVLMSPIPKSSQSVSQSISTLKQQWPAFQPDEDVLYVQHFSGAGDAPRTSNNTPRLNTHNKSSAEILGHDPRSAHKLTLRKIDSVEMKISSLADYIKRQSNKGDPLRSPTANLVDRDKITTQTKVLKHDIDSYSKGYQSFKTGKSFPNKERNKNAGIDQLITIKSTNKAQSKKSKNSKFGGSLPDVYSIDLSNA